ncbi:glycosyltransferase [Rapidithrix thailandica]|uniref:Glycosyltransferase n=1 Tax=Rapidithrix thailandica TaxID=413964 RepID=A0AAW9S6U0_9BACT
MKVLQFGRYYPPNVGGIETVMKDITEGLNNVGVQCDVLCSNDKYSYKVDEISNYLVFRTKTLGSFLSTSLTPQLILKLKEICNHYDIIHLHYPDPIATLALYLVNPSQKIIVHWHSDIIRQKLALKFFEPLQNWLLKRVDKIIATTPNYIVGSKYLRSVRNKTIAVPIGIDTNILKPEMPGVNKIRQKFKGRKIVFSLGRLRYYKGFEYLIKAAQYLDDSFIILIGGDGELKIKLQEYIKSLHLEHKVKMLGKIPDQELANYYKASDVYCMSSIARSEAFGVVLIEAMSLAKPIVATNIDGSGVSWVNSDSETGYNVEPKNPRALAKAIKIIANNPKLKAKFSTNAENRFHNYFTREQMIENIHNIYTEVLHEEEVFV